MSVSALTRSVTLVCLFFSVNAVIIGIRKLSERTVFQKARTWAFGSLRAGCSTRRLTHGLTNQRLT